MNNNRDFKGIWIPKEIYLDDKLSWAEKILFIEIDSLDKEKGCFCSNEYFSKFLGVKERAISGMISKLKDLGYIRQEGFDGRKRFLRSNAKYRNSAPQDFAVQPSTFLLGRDAENCDHINTVTNPDIKPSCRNSESSDEESKPKKEKKVFDRDSNPHKLARLLAVCIQDNKPDASFPESTIQSWADEIDKLIRLDKAKVDDIAEVIQWCQKDDFWKANILSGKKLRKHFLGLSIKALQK